MGGVHEAQKGHPGGRAAEPAWTHWPAELFSIGSPQKRPYQPRNIACWHCKGIVIAGFLRRRISSIDSRKPPENAAVEFNRWVRNQQMSKGSPTTGKMEDLAPPHIISLRIHDGNIFVVGVCTFPFFSFGVGIPTCPRTAAQLPSAQEKDRETVRWSHFVDALLFIVTVNSRVPLLDYPAVGLNPGVVHSPPKGEPLGLSRSWVVEKRNPGEFCVLRDGACLANAIWRFRRPHRLRALHNQAEETTAAQSA